MAETTTTNAIETKKVIDLEEKTTPADADLFMAGDSGTASLKKFKWSSLIAAIKTKLAAWTFDTLTTTNKTLPGALNELNSNLGEHKTSSDHDERYYPKTDIDLFLEGKSPTSHTHDDRYYKEDEVDTKLNTKAATGSWECATLADFVTRVNESNNGKTYIGRWKDTGGWGPRGSAAWYHGFCILQNAPGGINDIDGFIVCQSSTYYYIGYITGTTTPSATWHQITKGDINGYLDKIYLKNKAIISGDTAQLLQLWASGESDYVLCLGVRDKTWNLSPFKSGALQLGTSNYKWGQIYSAVASISTSDRNEKHDIKELPASAKDFIMRLNPVSYKFNDGESGRSHYGMIAQDVETLMADLGISSKDFAGFVKSPKTEHIFDDDGKIVGEKVIEGEYTYGLRYEEFIAPLIKTVQIQQQEINGLKKYIQDSLSQK